MATDKEIESYALLNALRHGGKANSGPIVGQILGRNPDLKKEMGKLVPKINEILKIVNAMSVQAQEKKLKEIAPELLEVKEVKKKGLKDLKNAIEGKVVTRAAPNPNGPIHIGSARAMVLSFLYAQKYKGKFILRFDDTSPKTKPPMPEAYKWIEDDLKWLGAKIDRIEYASKRFEIYYEIIEELINKGHAYICNCDPEKWRQLARKSKACECRDLKPEEHMRRWKDMFSKYKEEEVVLRIKTDLNHKDPSRRDWWAAKVIDNPNHPITKNKYKVWPSYNLQSAVDDHEMGVTHILRGQEHVQNEYRQQYVYDYLGWKYPETVHHGRVILETGGLSTTKTREMIASGDYTGWDDPRLMTIRALRRRGFVPEAIRDVEISIGLNTNDAIVTDDKIAAANRTYVEEKSNRYMFVENPILIKIIDAPEKVAELEYHPDFPKRGRRKILTKGQFFITKKDNEKLKKGHLYRLMDVLNFKDLKFVSEKVDDYRKEGRGILHWVTKDDSIDIEVLMLDGSTIKGKGESALKKVKKGEIIQFNRFGFCVKEESQKFVYSHK